MQEKQDMYALWNCTEEEWADWKWQVKNRIVDVETLSKVISLSAEEEGHIRQVLQKFRMGITPYYASLMDKEDRNCPVRRQAVPTIQETIQTEVDMEDPLSEDSDSSVAGLTHRYPDRVLFIITDQCAMYCRHCTRRRFVGEKDQGASSERIEAGIEYIRAHKEVRDVLLSGGDCLLVSDEKLEYIIRTIREIPHVEIIRLGSRAPVVMPQRITKELADMLQKYHPILFNTHFNHSKEITEESFKACRTLAYAGIPLGNQTVLLRGINDSPAIMRRLVLDLVKMHIRPYYIYQCDLSVGIEHFRTKISKGLEIMEALRGHISGYAVPTYVVDAPGGGGKIPILPQYLISVSPTKVVLRNYEGVITTYADPQYTEEKKEIPVDELLSGVAGIMQATDVKALEPNALARKMRKIEQ